MSNNAIVIKMISDSLELDTERTAKKKVSIEKTLGIEFKNQGSAGQRHET